MERPHKPKRPPAADIMLLLGVILLIVGLLALGMNYLYYSAAGQVSTESQSGVKKYADKQAIETSSRDTTILSAVTAGAGLVLAGAGLLTKFVKKRI